MRNKVTEDYIRSRIKKITYTVLPDNKTTVCNMVMVNGYSIQGISSCVDPANYNQELGEKYSYERAFNKAWELEGYVLSEERYNFVNNTRIVK